MQKLIGRKQEKKILTDALNSKHSELIVVYGRRRVGKTFLINKVYKNNIVFSFSGLHKAPLKIQLENFNLLLSEKMKDLELAKSWLKAFYQLQKYINKLKSKKKKVIFIDEFPWLDSRKSNFLTAFDNFWNNYATKKDDLVVVICGSAASYMIKKIIASRGGLHNRITEKIQLKPFNLRETELLLKANKVNLTKYDILQIYMAIGGIPHYINRVLPGESVPSFIDRLCFAKDGFLRTEFDNIFFSLFQKAENHIAIIKTLSKAKKGFTRKEIILKSKIKSGGTITTTLSELEQSGFIESYEPYSGTKNMLFRLSDEYSMFYLKFIKNSKVSLGGTWQNMYNQNSYKIWSGFSFETVCLKHIQQIKSGLGISGIQTTSGSWFERNAKQGTQIDLIIDRADNSINICEIKFYNSQFSITKAYADIISAKKNIFKQKTNTKKNIFITMITTYGLKENKNSLQYISNELTMKSLFVE